MHYTEIQVIYAQTFKHTYNNISMTWHAHCALLSVFGNSTDYLHVHQL